ncbi:Rossmann-like and DUF2520 domain-containing protein [Legionella cardiaca]|uniref:DUF2520 domain-containing protein n=1 Tax=Legionella cardiaca TaxID=1071983 RepID=A0ABY8AV13_9GAMM|nr:Rossmann-like and DUF2520 domain-containing protein [Legionella cardiaca]WED42967.1 DUF2520 domain-containing protein [Legionella cardiaca]
MHFNLVGAGRLGKNIAFALTAKQQGQLGAICNRSPLSAALASQQIGSGTVVSNLKELPPVELTFITTPDDTIRRIADELAKEKIMLPGSIVVHCSGALNSNELLVLKKQGCHIASIHPLKAFRDNYIDSNAFQNCPCVVEGDDKAVALLIALFNSLGATLVPIKAEKKACYHAAAVFSSNYLVTLIATSIELLTEAGISHDLAKNISMKLMHSSFTNIEQTTDPKQALTGPLARGDVQTIEKHLVALLNPTLKALYRAAALATLPLTELEIEKKLALQQLLTVDKIS